MERVCGCRVITVIFFRGSVGVDYVLEVLEEMSEEEVVVDLLSAISDESLNVTLDGQTYGFDTTSVEVGNSEYSRLFQKIIFLSVIGPTHLYFLSVLLINCLSYTFEVSNKLKSPACPRTGNIRFMPVLHRICLSGPVGPMISEKSAYVVDKLGFSRTSLN